MAHDEGTAPNQPTPHVSTTRTTPPPGDADDIHGPALFALDTLIDFCEKNGLRYYFTGGGLIGVLRHRGFIPWDDDVDLGLPRKDFDRFRTLVQRDMPSGFGLCNRFTDSSWHFAMDQFQDLETEIEIHLSQETRVAHVWVDVFPLDGLPENPLRRWLHVKNIMLHRYLVQIAHIQTQVDAHRKRPALERAVIGLFKAVPVGKLLDSDRILDRLEKILRAYDFDETSWCGNMLGRYREREVVRTAWFGEAEKGPFEGREVSIPAQSDPILRALYGDYLSLPPASERVGHRVRILRRRKER